MASVVIRFVSEVDLVSDLIEFFEGGSRFCHVEFVLTSDQQKVIGIAKPYVGAHADHGINAYDDAYYTGLNKIDFARYYELQITDVQETLLLQILKANIGTDYDFTDILGIMLHREWHESNKFICSAFVTSVLWRIGLMMLNVQPGYQYKITPQILHFSNLLIGKQWHPVKGT